MLELSLVELLTALVVVAAGALVQGSVGFGLSIVAAPFLYELNPELVPGPLMMMGLAMGLMTVRRHAAYVNISTLKFATLGRIPGTFIGAWLLAMASASQMSLMLGTAVLLAVVISMTSYKVTATRLSLTMAGFFSGVFGTASSIGGPPMALILQNESPEQIKANLAIFFVVGSLMSIAVLVATGLFGWHSLIYGLSMLPGVWLGFWLAGYVSRYLTPEIVRASLLVICSLSGTFAILSAIQK